MLRLDKVVLRGTRTRLEPLTERHLPGLAAVIADGDLWQLPVTTVPHPNELTQFLAHAEAQWQANRELAFATVDEATGTIVGSTRFRAFEPAHRRVEIGFTFIARSWQRTHINTEAKYLMLCHAFETMQLNRVELLTDQLNAASRTAIARLGAQQEGVLRSHMVLRSARLRDSVIFSLIAAEWPPVKARLKARLVQQALKL